VQLHKEEFQGLLLVQLHKEEFRGIPRTAACAAAQGGILKIYCG
jgi:hypothetical protein